MGAALEARRPLSPESDFACAVHPRPTPPVRQFGVEPLGDRSIIILEEVPRNHGSSWRQFTVFLLLMRQLAGNCCGQNLPDLLLEMRKRGFKARSCILNLAQPVIGSVGDPGLLSLRRQRNVQGCES